MKRTSLNKYSSDALKAFDVYIAPIFLLGLGIVFIVLAFATSIPDAAEMSEVRGHLESYYHKQTGRGHDDYTTIVILTEGMRFWTSAVNKDNAAQVFSKQGAEVRFYREQSSTTVPLDGAIKSYGLWVDGQEVESLNSSLQHDETIVRLFFPLLGVFLIKVAFLIYQRSKGKYAE